MNLLDGKLVSEKIKEQIALDAAEFTTQTGRKPHLVAILVGNDGGSETYVASKMRNCQLVGFESTNIRYDENITEDELIAKVKEINQDESIDGLIVQLPLPKHIDPDKVTEAIDYRKDVDGFHPINLGRMQRNLPCFIPATPYGIMLMLDYYKIDTAGKHAVVVGRSNIVGSPMSILLARNSNPGNCTVTLTHSRTKDLKTEVLRGDIVVAAIGKKNFVTADMVKDGAVVIDVGINRETSTATKSGFKLYGDVDFENVAPKASWITPVPGGVGLMTIVGLLKNTLEAAKGTIYPKQ
ncbi:MULTISPECIES: bifunctional 5,10-methylenetetrahydrofolate dehydrogenase/5,10-methenyltetrahydrofolate cyclohydrolase [Sphingobacterium]|jgi:methylenetetrahydrofolate dehydrogenase (NADP+)/methenyltetrahydrofolate cyclohydrolase|uniref:Tetrahydrofolate dehydrogenase/cyclohydrolase catalytic domain-containing protein n=3 Tax=Sphingobacterium TaxID=28453 RepID=A0ACD5BZW4_9SPHI|nr:MULTISPECIES: tetrahydrofolate dehydrogenase/cyclohydrolase catalytic domain-containing protein [Sphingobacterium]MBB1647773.1 bifunctional 5,10-methylene-tetrahydrofolate dehydrogenase/5,10-methylene-tetrahydrofolate cyclohydrolase [Sphingobacterium sp. UME9]MCS4167185.1 methylenetetrahydrofolate dehydrogenase (NADP+)/methenyltetrahydrofolate cyclohydrolase [Sphingobacterium sp. BIGb0116]QMV70699.1 bifunctional 5,10-methylene-tetrahydrofolate dehydrogenase/5,10-methylene-tetrahydrofolate cyc